MITLSAYTQPPSVDTTVALRELPQIQSSREDYETNEINRHEDDQDSFAEILASALHKTGEEEQSTAEETSEVSPEDFSEVQIDAAAFAGEGINFLNNPQTVIIAQEEITEGDFSEVGISEIEISEIGIAEDYLNTDIENMQIAGQAIAGEEGLPQDFIDTDQIEYLSDFPQETTVAAGSAQKTLSSEANGKEINKNSAFNQSENEISLAGSRSKEAASLQKETEREGRGKPGEAQSKGRKDKISFEVRDMRSSGAESQNVTQVKAGAQIVERVQDTPVKEITLELKLPGQAQSSAQTAWETKAGSAMENMLARELHQNFNGDIVRHASMALHDGGEGIIKLALKPDSLGNVKIHLKMSENKITGHIVVESEEALNAFKKEITSLEQAFRESGFTNAQLNLSLAADQRNTDWQEQKAPSFLPGMAASRYDGSFEGDSLPIVDVFFGQRHGSVNMLA